MLATTRTAAITQPGVGTQWQVTRYSQNAQIRHYLHGRAGASAEVGKEERAFGCRKEPDGQGKGEEGGVKLRSKLAARLPSWVEGRPIRKVSADQTRRCRATLGRLEESGRNE